MDKKLLSCQERISKLEGEMKVLIALNIAIFATVLAAVLHL
jgi:hypothetical protein